MQYSRYERVADDLGIPHDLMEEYLIMDSSHKIGSLMTISMTEELGKQWFGAVPPDLTLIARAKTPDYLYTYLRSFYRDPERPMGVNNKVFPNVGMPHALIELQGLQACAMGPSAAGKDAKRDPLTGESILEDPCGSFTLVEEGSMTPEEFDEAVYDLVNFLVYVGEPAAMERQRIGVYVLLFIAVFFVFAWLLNREYWKDVH
jgi:ubiquinol-cytochrome c reductase cytochrome b subunit